MAPPLRSSQLPPSASLPCGGDLTLLVSRAAAGLACVMDRACREQGLTDGRDWLVLTALDDGQQRSQLELARLLGIDKTTLTAVLDRLERGGHVVRRPDPADRRTRIPVSTPVGRSAWKAVARTRDRVEQALLDGRSPAELEQARHLLVSLAGAGELTSGCAAS